MKFLCVTCDEMLSVASDPVEDRGSVSLVFSCGMCGHKTALLTNPHETQVVRSLGVKIGRSGERENHSNATSPGQSNCPFTGMLDGMDGSKKIEEEISWAPQAYQRLENIPDFVRPMVRASIEKFARDNGHRLINLSVLDQARGDMGI